VGSGDGAGGTEARPRAGCGNCGAEIPIPPSGGIVRCSFCSASLYVESTGTVQHFVCRPGLEPSDVDGCVNRWLFEQGVSVRVEVLTRRLVYYPFWRIAGRAELVPAAASPEGTLDPLSGLAGELEPYDESLEDGTTFLPTTSPPPGGGDVRLVHVPVWHASFQLGAARETVLVEAGAGRVIAATAPAGTLGRPRASEGWILWGAAAVLVAVGGLVPWGWAALAGWVAVCAGVLTLLIVRGGGGPT
jgi:hypothetical protein